jgi:dipeptidyl aminopeptidase/acylaminoacyl peptidase
MISYRYATRASVLALALAAVTAEAQSVDPLAVKFGARESVRDIGISPDGRQVVLVAPRPDGGENAVVVSLANGAAVPILGAEGRTEQITDCQFVLETHLVCRIYLRKGAGRNVEAATRLVSVTADGSKMEQLTAQARSNAYFDSNYGGAVVDYNVEGNPQAVLMTRYFATERTTGSMAASRDVGLAVEEVDVVTLDRKRVEAPRETAFWYASDGLGHIRLMGTQPERESGYAKREYNFSYRPPGGGWNSLSQVTIDAGLTTGFEPIAVDPRENVVYGLEDNGNYAALYKMALDGSGTKTLVLGRDNADVDGVMRIGRSRRIIGASYATEYRSYEFFDPELKALVTSLGRALGDKEVVIVDATTDENKLVVFAGSDTDPGAYYLFDKTTKQLAQMFPARPELAGIALGEMRPVQYPAADGTMIPGYLTLPPGSDGKNLPAIVLPHGGPSHRDEWGFDWLPQYFVAKGYAVLQPNYRGSSGLGTQWFEKNGFQSWETAIGDVNAAGQWLLDQGIAAPGKLAIFGWSYGGYAALQSQVLDPDLYKAVVAVAPVTDLERLREDSREHSNFLVIDNFIGRGPHVRAGSPAQHADAFRAPVLLFHGDADVNVGVDESRFMRDRLRSAGKQVEYVEFRGLDHYLDEPGPRSQMLSQSAAFISRALGLE